jgi:NAD-dependent deacetylase
MEQAIELVSKADIVLIVGTSLQVYPAAGLYRYAPAEAPIYIIDPAEIPLWDKRIHHIRKVATEGMKDFLQML